MQRQIQQETMDHASSNTTSCQIPNMKQSTTNTTKPISLSSLNQLPQQQLPSSPPATPQRQTVYTRKDMVAFDLLEHPIYIFDILQQRMWWANQAAISKIWNAKSLSDLLARDFKSDMSDASHQRMLDYLRRFQEGKDKYIRESWTMYPNGVRTTTKETCSGIMISDHGDSENNATKPPHMAILCECDLVTIHEDIDHASLRGVEMLRHLPVAVSQFDLDGNLMEQNPEALKLFGGNGGSSSVAFSGADSGGSSISDKECKAATTVGDPERVARMEDSSSSSNYPSTSSFASRFVDPVLGNRVFKEIQDQNIHERPISLEAQQYTSEGPRWSAIQASKSRDPVTGAPIILYSARDISDVIEAKNEATASSIEKSEMIAVLAHEIRTPLHQMIGFIELLLAQNDGDNIKLSSSIPTESQPYHEKERQDIVRTLKESTLSLMTIINDVVDLTNLEDGKIELKSIPFDPRGVCRGCAQAVKAIADQKQIQVHLLLLEEEDANSGKEILGDPNRIRQILLNLLSNAVKYTNPGGEVSVSMGFHQDTTCMADPDVSPTPRRQDSKVLRVTVRDNGIGIPQDRFDDVFHKFRQTKSSTAHVCGGVGLGLAISKILVEAMGGSIKIEWSERNVGTAVAFEIPIVRRQPQRQNQLQVQPKRSASSVVSRGQGDQQLRPRKRKSCQAEGLNFPTSSPFTTVDNSSDEPSNLVQQQKSPRSLNVLVAEDNKVNSKLVKAMLKKLGHSATIVENGKMAVQYLEERDVYDIVLMDVQMPGKFRAPRLVYQSCGIFMTHVHVCLHSLD